MEKQELQELMERSAAASKAAGIAYSKAKGTPFEKEAWIAFDATFRLKSKVEQKYWLLYPDDRMPGREFIPVPPGVWTNEKSPYNPQ